MYLKALELHGFKSFPEKTLLTFDKPVTAIVGPNGSGKSNIADALQWVMGEQSTKALRGGKMEDVIFSGTERRSQVGFAQVSLILDNEDGLLPVETSQVQVTRRYYRSGESEYFINKKQVRLKDVNELFMDTGLGRDGYSIIGQGKIDAILSAKSTDRREIFEEAAGISRFRYRKEESERKLQHAEDDLLRINDKISELELHVEPLRRQSETAKRYLMLRDELRGLEISLWMIDLEELSSRTEKLRRDSVTAKYELEQARGQLEKIYSAAGEIAEKMRQKDLDTEQVREQVSSAELAASQREADAAVLEANLNHSLQDIERIEGELRKQEGQDTGLSAQIQEKRDRMDQIRRDMLALDRQAGDIKRRLEELLRTEGAADDKLSELLGKSGEINDLLSRTRAELSSAETAISEMETRRQSLSGDLALQEKSYDEALDSEKKNAEECQVARERCISLENVVKGYTMRADSAKSKLDKLVEEARSVEIGLSSLHSRIQLLSDMEREYEGYSKAVKTVMRESARGRIKGVRGPAGELLKVQDKYSLAIETAMGAAMQNIIVETDSDGKSVINMLKRMDGGRVTCRPMSVIRGRRIREQGLESEEGFEGIAFDLVSFDREYENIYLDLLGSTAVVDSLESAVKMARKHNHKFRIVTLDGQVINSGGSMTGGSASKGTGILSRANELKAAKAKVLKEETKAEQLKKQLEESRRGAQAAEYELKTASNELRNAQDFQVKLEAERRHYEILTQSLKSRVEQLKREAGELENRLDSAMTDKERTVAAVIALEAESAEISEKIECETGGRQKLNEARREIEEEETGVREQRASLETEFAAQERAAGELEKLRIQLSGDRQAQLNSLEDLNKMCGQLRAQIEEKNEQADQHRQDASKLRCRITELSQEKMELEGERMSYDRKAQEQNKQLLSLEREAGRIEQRIQAAGMEEKQIIDKLWDNYELSRSAAMKQRLTLPDIQEAKLRTGELRRQMSALGTPNIGAIEEFERINSRYEYLTGQRDDIDKSRRELLGIISDITDEMKEIFKTEFDKINESFKETFLELFGGGKASLQLEDPEDILGCGIEIKVQPPGKSLKTITLLSGGEKAFVAIALYFAIIRVRPTPFVVMDEIEAALDEANVVRVSKYVRRLSDKTQFLEITHRRGTMEEADVLYGVTMQEQGVSKVIKVDLDEAEKTLR